MNIDNIINALLGGSLIGVSAVFLMLTIGRISGISGIASGLLSFNVTKDDLWRAAFVIGLLIGPIVYAVFGGKLPDVVMDSSFIMLIVGGVLVGFGASLGSGCTSGHGVCGIARISPRSLVATGVFLITAIVTVFLSR